MGELPADFDLDGVDAWLHEFAELAEVTRLIREHDIWYEPGILRMCEMAIALRNDWHRPVAGPTSSIH